MSHLRVERRGHLLLVTFDRPEKKNAMTPEMVVRLADAWRRLRDDDDLRVAVITGTGDAFCAGADLGRLIPLFTGARGPEDEFDRAIVEDPAVMQTALLRKFELWKPIVAAVNGFALAGGAELLQATDVRFASENATFAITEAARGLLPAGGSTVRLPRQVSYVEAMRILLVGERLSAAEAKRIGFVNDVVPRERLMEIALDTAERIAENGPLAVRKIKESVLRGSGLPLRAAYEIEDECAGVVLASDDAKEGPRAFMEKRPARFTGR